MEPLVIEWAKEEAKMAKIVRNRMMFVDSVEIML